MKRLILMLYTICICAVPNILSSTLEYTDVFLAENTILAIKEINNQQFQSVNYSGLKNFGNPGEPFLPVKTLTFCLPSDACNIHLIETSVSDKKTIVLDAPVFPASEDSPLNQDMQPSGYCSDIYRSTTNIIPAAQILHVENYKGIVKLVTIGICPFEYVPGNNSFSIYEKISVKVGYDENVLEGHVATSPIFSEDQLMEECDFIKSIVANPQEVNIGINNKSRTAKLDRISTAYEYTIVTSAQLAQPFQRLVALKQQQGLNAGIVLIEDILTSSKYDDGDNISNINDDAGKLKAYLLDNADVIKYVLLGGKPPIVPMRYGSGREMKSGTLEKNWESVIPTDLYFGTDSSTNWNIDGDQFYGEYKDSFNYSSLFAIGRLLCTTVDEVNNYIDKLEIYQMNPGFGKTDYLSSAYTHISNDINNRLYTSEYVNELSSTLSSIYPTYEISINEKSPIHTGAYVTSGIVSARPGFIDLHGHGNPEGITTNDDDVLSYGINALDDERKYHLEELNNSLDNLDNFGYPGVMYSIACTVAPFDMPRYNNFGIHSEYDDLSYNFAESYTNGKNYGGVAFLGNTRDGYGDHSHYYEMEFLNSLKKSNGSITIGELQNRSRISYANSYSYTYKGHHVKLAHNIIGDPALIMWKPSSEISKISPIITRSDSTVTAYCRGNLSSTIPNSYGRLIVVEPSGKFHVKRINAETTSISGVSNNSFVYVHFPQSIPYIDDISIEAPEKFVNSGYVYGKTVTIGTTNENGTIRKNAEKVVFPSGINYIFDAQGDVFINGNIVIENEASVTIFSPGICHVDDPVINSGGKLIIFADSCVVSPSIKLGANKMEIYPYDKYGQKTNIRSSVKSQSQNYVPLLEEGKEWTYQMICHDALIFEGFVPTPDIDKFMRTLKIEGMTEIDGIDYYNVYEYVTLMSGEDSEDLNTHFQLPRETPLFYLAEDRDSGTVDVEYDERHCFGTWGMEREYPAKGMLYDFFNTTGIHGDATLGDISVQSEHGTLRGFSATRDFTRSRFCFYDNLLVVEGIGFIDGTPSSYKYGCDLFGEAFNITTSFPDGMHYPHLYTVKLADGTVLYKDQTYSPEMDSLPKIQDDTKVMLGNGGITVKCTGPVSLYDSKGCQISHIHADGESRIDTSALPHGLYLLVASGRTFKILI